MLKKFVDMVNNCKYDFNSCLGIYKDDFIKYLEYMKNIKTWYKLIPNLLTISRLIGMIPVNILFFTGNIVPAIILTGCLLITDFFDGKLARKWDVQSKLGADLDAASDKVIFWGLALPLLVSCPIILINVLGELLITLINVKGRIKGLDMKTVYSGKFKTCLLSFTLSLGYLVQFFHLPLSILRFFSLITGASQCVAFNDYVLMYNEKMEQKENEVAEDDIVLENFNNNERVLLLEKLKNEREFILSTTEPKNMYSGKKKIKVMVKKKKNI